MTAPAPEALSGEVDQRLGKPFALGARGPEAFYCLGLWLDLLERTTGIMIPDPFVRPEEEALRGFWRRFLRLASLGDLQPLDILFWRWGDGPARRAHVAMVEDARWAVSAGPETGVFRQPLEEACRRAESAYRLKELA